MYAAPATTSEPAATPTSKTVYYIAPNGWVYGVTMYMDQALVVPVWSPDRKADPNKPLSLEAGKKLYADFQRTNAFSYDSLEQAVAMAAMRPADAQPVAGVPAKKGQQRRSMPPKKTSPWVYVGVGASVLAIVGLIIYAARKD